jgi:hypothetical protein
MPLQAHLYSEKWDSAEPFLLVGNGPLQDRFDPWEGDRDSDWCFVRPLPAHADRLVEDHRLRA